MSRDVAGLTQLRHFPTQKFAMVASVGLMAGETILFHRRMLPQERPSLIGVTFVTEFIERIRF